MRFLSSFTLLNKSFITDSCQNNPLDFRDIRTNHGIDISKKIKKPTFVQIKLKKFFFVLLKLKLKENCEN